MAVKEKEVRLTKPYRIFVRNDNLKHVVGCAEYDEDTGEPDFNTIRNYGSSVTYTWVIGKYYEDDDPDKVIDKYEKNEMSTNE